MLESDSTVSAPCISVISSFFSGREDRNGEGRRHPRILVTSTLITNKHYILKNLACTLKIKNKDFAFSNNDIN